MPSKQGDLSLLDHPLAQELLHSTNPARLAYTWKDGTPRVVPIWFHWTGEEVVFGSPPKAPKVMVLPDRSHVALTIDSNQWPCKVLYCAYPLHELHFAVHRKDGSMWATMEGSGVLSW